MSQRTKTSADAAASPTTVIQCGCGLQDADAGGEERKAVAVDPDAKARNVRRLRLIEGQVRGLQKMVEDDRYCADILMQISSVHEALRSVGRELMRNHLKHCATAALKAGPETAEPMYDELVELMYRHSR
jgi:CsoR family transcriptional regulator, copper-sensing transcriptional repressor